MPNFLKTALVVTFSVSVWHVPVGRCTDNHEEPTSSKPRYNLEEAKEETKANLTSELNLQDTIRPQKRTRDIANLPINNPSSKKKKAIEGPEALNIFVKNSLDIVGIHSDLKHLQGRMQELKEQSLTIVQNEMEESEEVLMAYLAILGNRLNKIQQEVRETRTRVREVTQERK